MKWRLSETHPPMKSKPVVGLWFFKKFMGEPRPFIAIAEWSEGGELWQTETGAMFISRNPPTYWADPEELPPDPDEEDDDE